MKYWTNSLVKLFLISSFLLSTSYAKGPETATQFLPPDEAFIPSVEQIEDKQIRVSGPFAYEVDNKREDIKNNFINEFVQYFIIVSIVQNFQFK